MAYRPIYHSSGQEPAGFELGVAELFVYLQDHYDISVLETSPGYYEGNCHFARSCTETDLSAFVGSIQWVCRSPCHPERRRKNWFIDFSACAVA